MKKTLWSTFTLLLALAPFALAVGLYSKSAKAQRVQVDLNQPLFVLTLAKLDGTRYERAVILAAPLGDSHIGVILNKPTTLKMGDLFPDHAPSRAVQDYVYFGGPQRRDIAFVLARFDAKPGPLSFEFVPGVWLAFDTSVVDEVIETRPNEGRYFSGHVAWRTEDLAERIKSGYFAVRPADPEKLFSDPSKLYEQLAPAARGKGQET